MIRDVKLEDAKRIAEIYNYYIENTTITFEEEPVTEKEIQNRIESVKQGLWIIKEIKGIVVGYAYANQFRQRSAFIYSLETSVYIDIDEKSKGYGKDLYKEIINRAKNNGYRVLIGVISVPNKISVKIHKNLGFEKKGEISNVGYKFNKWLDIEYWQKNI